MNGEISHEDQVSWVLLQFKLLILTLWFGRKRNTQALSLLCSPLLESPDFLFLALHLEAPNMQRQGDWVVM